MWEWLSSAVDSTRPHVISDFYQWHARIMFLAWGVIAPLAIIIARFFKILPGQDWPRELDNKFWWRCHWIGQMLVFAISLIVALILIYTSTGVRNLHSILGYAVILLVTAQVLLGLFRGGKGGPTDPRADGLLDGDHYSMTVWRRTFEWTHKSIGYLGLLLAWITVFIGLWDVNAPRWMWLGISVWWCTLVTLYVMLQQRGFAIDTYQAIWGPDLSHPGNRLPAPGWGMRRLNNLHNNQQG